MKTFLTTVLAVVAMNYGFSQSQNNSQNDPCDGLKANFASAVDAPAGGVHFRNTSVSPNGEYSSMWDFGNGKTSQDSHPFMMFDEGTYQVTLVVTDANGCKSTKEKEVTFSYGGK